MEEGFSVIQQGQICRYHIDEEVIYCAWPFDSLKKCIQPALEYIIKDFEDDSGEIDNLLLYVKRNDEIEICDIEVLLEDPN